MIASFAVFIAILVSNEFSISGINLFYVFLALSSAFLVTGAGNTINDYYDYSIDKKNRPNRPIPSGDITREESFVLSVVLFLGGIVLSFFINIICFSLVMVNSLLLFLYAKELKSVPLVGNSVVGFLVGSTFLYGGLVVGSYEVIVILSFLAALATLGREIAKDIEDVEGDKSNVRTIATEFGINKSSYLASITTLCSVLLSPLPYHFGYFDESYLVIVLLADLLFMYALVSLVKNKSIKAASKFQSYSKLAMVLALFSFIIGSSSIL